MHNLYEHALIQGRVKNVNGRPTDTKGARPTLLVDATHGSGIVPVDEHMLALLVGKKSLEAQKEVPQLLHIDVTPHLLLEPKHVEPQGAGVSTQP